MTGKRASSLPESEAEAVPGAAAVMDMDNIDN